MPGYDGTGPMGAGPMTGGARGYCSPAYAGQRGAGVGGFGRGMAYRRGGGYGPGRGAWGGFGRRFAGAGGFYGGSPADEAAALKQQARAMQNSLDAIAARIAELEKEKDA
ncbi:MAG: DUF5320 domain-containing protein [Thermodesulfobacteriota bacterium]